MSIITSLIIRNVNAIDNLYKKKYIDIDEIIASIISKKILYSLILLIIFKWYKYTNIINNDDK